MKLNKLFFVIFFLKILILQAQLPNFVKGKVLYEGKPLSQAHIENLNHNFHSLTDENGVFSIRAFEDNMLKISYLGKKDVFRKISTYDLQHNEDLIIIMREASIELDGVEVSKNQQFTAQSLGILNHQTTERTYAEKKVFTQTKLVQHPWYTILVGALRLNLLAVVNKISGKSKIIKQEAVNEKNLVVVTYIIERFSEFLQKELKLNEEEIAILAFFVMEKSDFHALVAKKDDNTLRFLLIEAWNEYQKKSNETENNSIKN